MQRADVHKASIVMFRYIRPHQVLLEYLIKVQCMYWQPTNWLFSVKTFNQKIEKLH